MKRLLAPTFAFGALLAVVHFLDFTLLWSLAVMTVTGAAVLTLVFTANLPTGRNPEWKV